MIYRAIYSHYSRPQLDGNTRNEIGWYTEKHFWIGFALSVYFSSKWFEKVAFYTDNTGSMMASFFGIEFNEVHSDFNSLDLPASLWSIPKIHAIARQQEPFLHIDSDVFLTKPLSQSYLTAQVLAQSYEHPRSKSLYEFGLRKLKGDEFYLTEDFRRGVYNRTKFTPVNCGIVGGNNIWVFRKYTEQVLEMVETNFLKFEDVPTHEYCVTLEQWFLSAFCHLYRMPVTVLLRDIKDADRIGYKHYIAARKRDKERCEKMEITASRLIPKQLKRIEQYFLNQTEYKIGRAVEAN